MVLGLVMVLQMLTRDGGPDEDEVERVRLISEIKEKNSMNSFIILQEIENHLKIRGSFKSCIALVANSSSCCVLSRHITFPAYCNLIRSCGYISGS